MELLSLKWNKHSTTFFNVLSALRMQECHTDVYLGCEGQLFPVHQIVLTVCSEYFASIFKTYKSKDPVIILKDISKKDLKLLLDYMYIGEVNVKQSDLASLISAAELLQIKGLAVEDDPDPPQQSKRPQTPEQRLSSPPKRARREYLKDVPVENPPSARPVTLQDSYHSASRTISTTPKLVPIDEIKLEQDDSLDGSEENIQTKKEFTEQTSKSSEISDHQMTSEAFEKEEFDQTMDDSMDMAPENTSESFEGTSSQSSSQSDQIFNQMISLVRVAGLKYHKCNTCGKHFPDQSNARNHIYLHTGDTPFHCRLCAYRSRQRGNMRRHLQLRHQSDKDADFFFTLSQSNL